MPDKVRIGIAGSGFAAHFHLASYRKVYGEDFEVVAIASRNGASAAALAQQFGVPRVVDGLDALLRDPGIDVVDLCVPNHLHAPSIVAAAAAGKHIICEKPLAGYFGPDDAPDDWTATGVSRADMLAAAMTQARAIRTAIDTAGVTFCYGENWVYAPPIAKLDRLMAASGSTIMRIQGEESHSGSHSPYSRRWRTSGGGSLLRLCVHPIGAALHLKAEEGRRRDGRPIRPVSVVGEVANLTHMATFQREEPKHMATGWQDVEDWATVVVTFEDGSVAQLTSTDTHLGGIRNYITAYGSRALATANINPNTMVQAYTPAAEYFDSEYIVEKLETKAGWSMPAADEDAVTGYPEELRDFIGSIANGRAPKSDLALAMDVLAIVYAGYLSAAEGRRVALDEFG